MKNLKDLTGFEAYMIEEELSKSTINVYTLAVRQFFESFDELNKTNLVLRKEQLSRRCSPQTVNLKLTGMERYCKYKGINLSVKRIKIQKKSSVENVITVEQYRKLLAGLKADGNERWAFHVELLAKTGARISEALQFTKGDLVRGYVDLHTKGKYRRVYIPKSLLDDAPQYVRNMKDGDRLFISYCKKPITSRAVSGELKKFAVKYGIPRENCHPHAFRHMFAMQFLKKTNNISLLADVLGHSGVNTTVIYTRMSQEQQKKAVNDAVDW